MLNRGGLFDLDLRQGVAKADLPCEVFTCKTLVELKLTGFSCIKELPEDSSLPALKKLFLKSVKFYSLQVCAFEKLLSACPVLEELVLDDLRWEQWKRSRSLSSRSLRKLTIRRTYLGGYDMSDFGNITIDTPSVTHLDYSDLVPTSYLVVNLNSLVQANLRFVMTLDHRTGYSSFVQEGNITSNPTNLLKGMRNVQIINLLSWESLEIFNLFRETIPVFENLLHLSITTFSSYGGCWRGLVYLLNNCPNLETLTIKGTLHSDPTDSVCDCVSGYSFLLSCPVKVVKITDYRGYTGEFLQLKNILEKLSRLELLEVRIWGRDDMKFQKAEELLRLPRVSSKCKIKFN